MGANPAATSATTSATSAAPNLPFDFVALGDMPYGPDLISGPAYRHLIDLINELGLPLAIHVGDFKDGWSSCADAVYARQQQYFQRFAQAVVYTPGDNDWIDCQRRADDPLERLSALRQRFFAKPMSGGQHPIAVQRQADVMPGFERYVENLRWTAAPAQHGVVFATFHTVGPDNGFEASSAKLLDEAHQRDAANAAWITAAFALARSQGARALVLATQAETLGYPDPDHPRQGVVRRGFAHSINRTLLPLAEAAPHPVLLIHGDDHHFTTDLPFRNAQGQRIANLWRLEVFGEPRMHAVRVRVNTQGAGTAPFEFTPIWNPQSPDPRMPRRRSS